MDFGRIDIGAHRRNTLLWYMACSSHLDSINVTIILMNFYVWKNSFLSLCAKSNIKKNDAQILLDKKKQS